MYVRNKLQPQGVQRLAGETRLRLAPGCLLQCDKCCAEGRWREWFILSGEVGAGCTRRDIGSGLENQSLLGGGGG